MKLLFLVSQPRSGSTMLQAVLSNHAAVATRSEPWVQLLQAAFSNPDLVRAPFNWKIAVDAVDRVEPEGRCLEEIRSALRMVIDQFYSDAAKKGQSEYFLDKTPRYYYILEELYTQYPEAKFIVLFRNPASVLASIYKTWLSEKRYEALYDYSGDLIEAPRLMQDFVKAHGSSSRVMSVEYESLIQQPEQSFSRIFEWLDLEFSESLLNYQRNESYAGKYGDPVGVRRGKVVARRPVMAQDYLDVFPNRRLARLAQGLTCYYQRMGYVCPGSQEWEASKATKQFDRFLRAHRFRNKKQLSVRDALRVIVDRVSERLGCWL
jgi:hypothetical protein